MKIVFYILFIALLLAVPPSDAAYSELYVKFIVDSREEIVSWSASISVDDIIGDTVYAYVSEYELKIIKNAGYKPTIMTHPGKIHEPAMTTAYVEMTEWDVYPTYGAYVDMMYQFASDYPSLCQIIDAGTTVLGRNILFAKISDNVDLQEDEPEVMYTSSMHGDETTGYILMLRLIDSLLTGYQSDSMITGLVDNCEIWINPLANPDGTYYGGDETVYGAVRKNGGGVDLNRNFPDPEEGEHPGGTEWQPETVIMMQVAEDHNFVISANFHGGTEVVNYPWDTWAVRHADDPWFLELSNGYADSAQFYSPDGYMERFGTGVTNGYDWYSITGGRQDYMNWWHGCREVTIEISEVKLLPADQLPAHWVYNRVSLLNYLENGLFGIRGVITDLSTGLPVSARIEITGHDFDHSEVYTDPDVGDYHRMIDPGMYTMEVSAPGYYTQTEFPIFVSENEATRKDIQLIPLPDSPVLEYSGYSDDEIIPGDTTATNIILINSGGYDALNITGLLHSQNASVTIIQPYSAYPDIPAGGGTAQSIDDFVFYIEPTVPQPGQIEFQLYVTGDDGLSDTVLCSLMVGNRFIAFQDDFSDNQGWSGLGGPGEWEIGPAAGGEGDDDYGGFDPIVDVSPGTDNHILGNDLQPFKGGDYSNGLGETFWVTSPSIDCSALKMLEISFYYWLGVENNPSDFAFLQAFNGEQWITLYENDTVTIGDSYWKQMSYDLSTCAEGNPDFQMRFGIGPTNSLAAFCGWNIDDLIISGYDFETPLAPQIAYSPAEFTDTLMPGEWQLDTIKISNVGNSNLWVRFNSSDSYLYFDTVYQNIPVNDSLDFQVLIITTDMTHGSYNGFIDFTTNDPSLPTGTIQHELTILAPEIFLNPAAMNESLSVDENSTKTLNISNNGNIALDYEISFGSPGWLGLSQSVGSIAPENSDLVMLHFDAAGLTPEVYSAQLEISSNDPITPIIYIPVELQVFPVFKCGDINGDESVNILDVTYLVNYLYKGGSEPGSEEAADVNNSGEINILDVTHLINYLYKSGPELNCPLT